MRKLFAAVAIAAALAGTPVLTGCAQVQSFLGVEPVTAQNPREMLLEAEATYQTAIATASDLVDNGTIATPEAKAALLDYVTQADAAMQSARAAVKAGSPNAVTLLTLANTATASLLNYARAQEAKSNG